MIQYIHKKNGKKKFTDHHNTSVKNVHTERTMWGGGQRGCFVRPSTESVGRNSNKKMTIKIFKKKSWLRSFQAAAKRPNTVSSGEGCYPVSSLPLSLSLCLSSFPRSLSRT